MLGRLGCMGCTSKKRWLGWTGGKLGIWVPWFFCNILIFRSYMGQKLLEWNMMRLCWILGIWDSSVVAGHGEFSNTFGWKPPGGINDLHHPVATGILETWVYGYHIFHILHFFQTYFAYFPYHHHHHHHHHHLPHPHPHCRRYCPFFLIHFYVSSRSSIYIYIWVWINTY